MTLQLASWYADPDEAMAFCGGGDLGRLLYDMDGEPSQRGNGYGYRGYGRDPQYGHGTRRSFGGGGGRALDPSE